MASDFKLRRLFAAAIFTAIGVRASVQTYEFTTLAGDAGYGSKDGIGGDARFSSPSAVVVDGRGNLYVSDSGNHTIRKITPAGMVTTIAGRAGYAVSEDGTGSLASVDGTGSYARFSYPGALLLDLVGNLLVSDGAAGIRKVTPDGVVTTLPGTEFAAVGVFDKVGNNYAVVSVFVGAAILEHGIRKITPAGVATEIAGVTGRSVINGTNGTSSRNVPSALAIDGGGNLLFAENSREGTIRPAKTEYLGAAIRRVEADGSITTVAGSLDSTGTADGPGNAARFLQLSGMAVDSIGNIYATDSGSYCIRKVSPGGVVTTLAGSAGMRGATDGLGSAARFGDSLGGLAVGGSGDLFLADSTNNIIRKITADGVVTTIAGKVDRNESGLPNLLVDGTGSAARFDTLRGVAVDGGGNLYVADGANRAIRRVSPAGVVTTLVLTYADDGRAISTPHLSSPAGIAIDVGGNLFVSDIWMVRKISPSGVVTTLAGALTGRSSDGPGDNVNLGSPEGVAVDRNGNVIVADARGSIRRITADGVVTVLAGDPTSGDLYGSADGVGSVARFRVPSGVAVDADGNVFVADTGNHTIRKITPGGVVTTIAGTVGVGEAVDGIGSAARFFQPQGIAVDSAGNLFVTDVTTLRKITPGGVVTTIAGKAGNRASADGTGSTARFGSASAVAVDNRGNVFVADFGNKTIRKGVRLANPARLANVSVLATLPDGGDTVTVGAIIGGAGTSGTEPLLVRAAGPSLAPFGVPGRLDDPKLEFFTAAKVGENDNWSGTAELVAAFAQVSAFPFASPNSKDAALSLPAVAPGNHTVRISGNGVGGAVLAELYDAAPLAAYAAGTPRLTNVSVLNKVGAGLTAGFMVGGTSSMTVLIRAVGPSLAPFGVSELLADPKFELFDGQSRRIAVNDNWSDAGVIAAAELSAAFAQVGAFVLAGPTAKDAALLVTLTPGSYTVQVRSADTTTGLALVEIYEVP